MQEDIKLFDFVYTNKLKKWGFTEADFFQILAHGVPLELVEQQVVFLRKGVKKQEVYRAARKSDGIRVLSKPELISYIGKFETGRSQKKIMKFVPASGAASRMFRFLSHFLLEFDIEKDTINSYINKKNDTALQIFIAGLEKFPFYKEVKTKLKSNYGSINALTKEERIYYFIKIILESEEFNYINKPKAVLPFHLYENRTITPIEEHLKEAALYANSDGFSEIHFTISPNHQLYFDAILSQVKRKIEEDYAIQIEISFSVQESKTDSIALQENNMPFRTETEQLLFRPGGHGALLQNLNALDADLIFIKNIDNVTNGESKKLVAYKKGLAGLLLSLQQKTFEYLALIEKNDISCSILEEIFRFVKEDLNICFPDYFEQFKEDNQITYIQKLLNRPIRVCGMVKNEGEPGGGPFWVVDNKGWASLRIVESSQIDKEDVEQVNILKSATHFNPVDIVCGVKDYKGNKFDLMQFVDGNSGFVVTKNHKGQTLKSYELPGLWNGGMGDWISVFVEVPLSTFNPVKTINDLLNSSHMDE